MLTKDDLIELRRKYDELLEDLADLNESFLQLRGVVERLTDELNEAHNDDD